MRNKRGLAILISCDYKNTPGINPLSGTTKDADEMRKTFQQFEYSIHQLKNEEATFSNIEMLLECLGKYLKKYDGAHINDDGSEKVIIFTFSGHGANPNLLLTNDGDSLFLKDVMEPLVNPKIERVKVIPKLFMIDACRGSGRPTDEDDGVGSVKGNYRLDFATLRDQKAGADEEESIWMPELARDLRNQQFSYMSYQALVDKVNHVVYAKFEQEPQSQGQLTVGPPYLRPKKERGKQSTFNPKIASCLHVSGSLWKISCRM